MLGACFHLAYDISCSFCLGNAGAGDPSEPTGQIPLKVSQESRQNTPGFFMRRHAFKRVYRGHSSFLPLTNAEKSPDKSRPDWSFHYLRRNYWKRYRADRRTVLRKSLGQVSRAFGD